MYGGYDWVRVMGYVWGLWWGKGNGVYVGVMNKGNVWGL